MMAVDLSALHSQEGSDIAHLISEATVVRICHDLASPSGALTNGVELLGMALGDESFQNEAIGLLKNSTTALGARLDFFRAAFGNASAKGLTPAGAKAIVEKYVAQLGDSARVFSLDGFPAGAVDGVSGDPEWWRFAVLMVLVAAESMPYGGQVTVFAEKDLPVLQVTGRQAVLPDQFFQDMSQIAQIDPRTLGSVALRYFAARRGLAVSADTIDDGFAVQLAKKDL